EIYLDAVEAEYGQRPVIYTTPDFYADWVAGNLEDYPIWLRSLSGPPVINAAIWQYDMRGELAGIKGPVDRNRVP
ncbi:MAG: GH25 family lysozyme, partial [Hyphomonas sp.]